MLSKVSMVMSVIFTSEKVWTNNINNIVPMEMFKQNFLLILRILIFNIYI